MRDREAHGHLRAPLPSRAAANHPPKPPTCSEFCVSSRLASTGDTLTNMSVLAVPPMESLMSIVSYRQEDRQGWVGHEEGSLSLDLGRHPPCNALQPHKPPTHLVVTVRHVALLRGQRGDDVAQGGQRLVDGLRLLELLAHRPRLLHTAGRKWV